MATPKSTDERVKRKIRVKGPRTPHDDHNMPGRIVVKKTANNDPRRNKAKKLREAIGNFYLKKSEILKEDIVAALPVIEKLIKCAMHFEGKFPFKLDRLSEMRDTLKAIISEEITHKTDPKDEYTATFKVSARVKENVEGVWRLLNTMQMLGSWGASRKLSVFVDGDGADRIKVEVVSKDDELKDPGKEEKIDNEPIEISLEGLNGQTE